MTDRQLTLEEATSQQQLEEAQARFRREVDEAVARGADRSTAQALHEIPDPCDNCHGISWVSPLDRKRWTCYSCGTINRREPPLRPPTDPVSP